MKVVFGPKSNGLYQFYSSAKDGREKINELQAMIFDEGESASDAQKFPTPPKHRILEKKNRRQNFEKTNAKKIWGALKNEMSGIV